jgi:hypothetical protein
MRSSSPFEKPTTLPANIINRFVLLVDASLSMKHLSETVVKVFDNFIAHLAVTSKAKDQETRVTIYTFSSYDSARCVIWDMDVLRVPSLAGLYHASGNTALIQTFLRGVRENREIPVRYGDNSTFFLGLTDGEENDSVFPRHDYNARRRIVAELSGIINNAPDNETYGLLVPDQKAVHEAMQHGFPRQNISVWDSTSAEGLEEAGSMMREVADYYMDSRAQGVKGFSARSAASGRGLFHMRNFTASDVKSALVPMTPGSYYFIDITEEMCGGPRGKIGIEKVFTSRGRSYPKSQCYYQFTDTAKVQSYKDVAIETGEHVYSGTLDKVRGLVGLPDGLEVTVKPTPKPGMTVFIQSTSHNRNLFPGTRLLVFR